MSVSRSVVVISHEVMSCTDWPAVSPEAPADSVTHL